MKKLLILFMLLTIASNSWGSIYIDCDDSTPRVKKIPGILDEALHISCTFLGNIVEANRDWAMINLMSQQPFFVPAQISIKPKEKGNRSYFKSISTRILSPMIIAQKYELISKTFDTKGSTPKTALVMTLKNNLDLDQKLYLFSNHSGYLCTPLCKEGNIFMLQNINKKSLF